MLGSPSSSTPSEVEEVEEVEEEEKKEEAEEEVEGETPLAGEVQTDEGAEAWENETKDDCDGGFA